MSVEKPFEVGALYYITSAPQVEPDLVMLVGKSLITGPWIGFDQGGYLVQEIEMQDPKWAAIMTAMASSLTIPPCWPVSCLQRIDGPVDEDVVEECKPVEIYE